MVGEITLLYYSLIGLKFTQTLKVKPHEIRLKVIHVFLCLWQFACFHFNFLLVILNF